ncbi:MAG: hemerythrin domain-containing protein [Actinomycetota bacterium]|jgi:hypothetical protein|nr:hemerythrin domain-containing protein [Actinomycetota bacterium]
MTQVLLALIDRLEGEHREVRAALAVLGDLGDAGDAAGLRAALPGYASVLGPGLDEHSRAEDSTLFPAVHEVVGRGVVEAFTVEHGEILAWRDALYEARADVERLSAVLELRELLESHLQREEALLFPSIRDALGSTA